MPLTDHRRTSTTMMWSHMNDQDSGETGSDAAGSQTTVLDVSGLQCPLPVLKAQKALRALGSGDVLQLISTDPMAAIDVPHFCAEHGHQLLRQDAQGDAVHYHIQKRA